MAKGKRRTSYWLLFPKGKKEQATSKEALFRSFKVAMELHKDFPETFPKPLKAVRRRQERILIGGRVPIWATLKEVVLKKG